MLQAMTTGHDGSLSTGHANSPRDMLRRLETMVLMTGYQLPLRAIREQIASAVDLIVHTARLKDGTRKIVEHHRGLRDRGRRDPDPGHLRVPADRLRRRARSRASCSRPASGRHSCPSSRATASSCRPASSASRRRTPAEPVRAPSRAAGAATRRRPPDDIGEARARQGGGGGRHGLRLVDRADRPGDRPASCRAAIKEHARQCLENLKAKLEGAGTSLDKIVWANWSLRDATEFDTFNEEWVRWFPGDAPVGQGTLMPPLQRRAGFRVSIGVIAEA